MADPVRTIVRRRVIAIDGDPVDGQVVAWNATQQAWVPAPPSGVDAGGDPGITVTDSSGNPAFLSAAGASTGYVLKVNTALDPPFEFAAP